MACHTQRRQVTHSREGIHQCQWMTPPSRGRSAEAGPDDSGTPRRGDRQPDDGGEPSHLVSTSRSTTLTTATSESRSMAKTRGPATAKVERGTAGKPTTPARPRSWRSSAKRPSTGSPAASIAGQPADDAADPGRAVRDATLAAQPQAPSRPCRDETTSTPIRWSERSPRSGRPASIARAADLATGSRRAAGASHRWVATAVQPDDDDLREVVRLPTR